MRHHTTVLHSFIFAPPPPSARWRQACHLVVVPLRPLKQFVCTYLTLFVGRYGAFLRGATETATEIPHRVPGLCRRRRGCQRLPEGEYIRLRGGQRSLAATLHFGTKTKRSGQRLLPCALHLADFSIAWFLAWLLDRSRYNFSPEFMSQLCTLEYLNASEYYSRGRRV